MPRLKEAEIGCVEGHGLAPGEDHATIAWGTPSANLRHLRADKVGHALGYLLPEGIVVLPQSVRLWPLLRRLGLLQVSQGQTSAEVINKGLLKQERQSRSKMTLTRVGQSG
jgi:hypothetical protein